LAGNDQGLKNRIQEAMQALPKQSIFSSPKEESKSRR